MQRMLARIVWLSIVLRLSSAGETALAAAPRDDACVVLISVDGLANFYLDDPRADMPTLRRLAREGARADGLVCSFPTVTWPNHTTLVTGTSPARHGVIGNNYLDRQSGEKIAFIPDPLFDKDEIVKVPTVYDAAHGAGLVTAGIVWPATRSARTLDWTVPDMFGDEAWPKYGTKTWLDELRQAGIPVDRHGGWTSESGGGVQRDWLYTRMAAHLFEHHPPNLLLIHLVEVDHVQHRHGPRSPDAYWSVSFADDRIRDLWESAQRSPFAKNTTFLIASDHGFFPIEHDIRPNARLRELGLIETEGEKITKKHAWCVAQGGACMVYILDDSRRSELAKELQREFAAIDGVQVVLGPEEMVRLGQPMREDDPRAPDFWLSAKSGYSFSEAHSAGEVVVPKNSRGGTHGYLPDQPDMLGTLVISGAGVDAGTKLGKVQSIDVAPTIARLLGVELPTAEGKPLLNGAARK
ncbi:MAG: ectonucleotide pyrophosphatase/phosphodiesterase [Planctomycetes bacterium]|nr:ectonucleotide pyrophosphatase/phosphodiesterase [Planctomycetota bacterium]